MIEQLTPEQEAKLPVYRQMYIDKFLGNNPPAVFKDVEEYMHWFYQRFEIAPNAPTVYLVDDPWQLYEKIAEVYDQPVSYYEPSFYLSAANSWVSFYDFFDKECLTLTNSELFNQYKRVLDLNILFSVTFDDAVFVCRNAASHKVNAEGTLHSVDGPATVYNTGRGVYFVRGVNLSEEVFQRLTDRTYTMEEWAAEQNEEKKSAALAFIEEKYGSEALADFIAAHLTEKDTYVDKKSPEYLEGTTGGMNIGVYTLFKGMLNGMEVAFVRCFCPSSDRMFMLSADPEAAKTAADAVASLYRVPEKLKSHIKYISRQGERFFTVFTDEGKRIRKTLTDEDIKTQTHLSGKEYFSLMRYEY